MRRIVLATCIVVSTGVVGNPAIADTPSSISEAPLSGSIKEPIEEQDERVPTIVITPNRYPTELSQVGSSTTVVDEQEIEAKRQDTLFETLRGIPGITVVQTGGPGRSASIFIRGAESDHTLVLLDGVRVNDNATGPFNFADLTTENIERVEVLRGPQSVLYGSEAIGGVINIITKKAQSGTHGTVSAQGGSYGTQKYSASVSAGNTTLSSRATASYYKTDGLSAAASNRGNPEDDSYENITLSNQSSLQFLDDGIADLTLRYSQGTTEFDDFEFGVGAVDDPNAVQDSDSFASSLQIAKPLTEWLSPKIVLGATQQEYEGTDPDTDYNNYRIENDTRLVTSTVDFVLPWNSVLTVGHHYEHQESKNIGNFDQRKDIQSFFAQEQLTLFENLFLTAGARYDHDSKFGDEVTYRTTASYAIDQTRSRLHASYGTGFKAPSFNELYFPNFGNPDLEPETSWGYDVGIEQDIYPEIATVDVTFFRNQIDNLITFDSETFLAANIASASTRGIESTLSLAPLEWLTTKTSYTYTESENETTGGLLPQRPRHMGSFQALLAPCDALESSLTFLLVNSRRDSDGQKMDNYHLVNLAISYRITEMFKPFVRVDNLFDKDYEEVNGYGTPGFSLFAGIEGSL